MSVKPKKSNWLLISLIVLLVLVAGYAIYKGSSKPKGKQVTLEKVEKRTIKEIKKCI